MPMPMPMPTMPKMNSATSAVAVLATRGRGVSPCRAAAGLPASSSARAPSLMPLALPSATVPSGRTTALSRVSAWGEVLRGCTSSATTIASPFSCKRLTDAISASNTPPRRAATALDCELSAISILRVALDAELLGDALCGLAVQTRKNPQVVHALEGFGPYETF